MDSKSARPASFPGAVFVRHLLRSLLGVLCVLGCAGALAQSCDAVTDITEMTRSQRALPGMASPAGAEPAQRVTVPDRIPFDQRSGRTQLVYQFDVDDCARSGATALWVFRVGAPYRITAAGEPLTLLGANVMALTDLSPERAGHALPGIHNGRIPALFALPAGVRTVSIELQTLPYIPSGVVKLATGPTNRMVRLHTASVRSVVGYADAASGVVLVIGLLCFLLWLPRRRDLNLLWLAAACGLWGVRGLVYFNNAVPGNPTLFEMLNPATALLSAVSMAAAALHLLYVQPLRRKLLLRMAWLTAAALLMLVVAAATAYAAGPARVIVQVLGTGFICWLGLAFWQHRRNLPVRHSAGLLACVLVLLVCVVHDLMVVAGPLPPTSGSLVFWGFILVLVGFALISGEYVVRTLDLAERSNEDLELRVSRKTAELESSYARLRDNERDVARAAERERIMREMHDGLGAQLMTALRGIERGALGKEDVARSLQEGLDELRLLMDSSDNTQALQTALANWRNRWDVRLAATGLTLHWVLDDSLEHLELPGDTVLQIMRVLQEAGANIVKHAQASEAMVHAGVHIDSGGARAMVLEVTDNGTGMPAESTVKFGRGLRNMRMRAQQIGATLDVTARADGRGGTTVRLTLPVAAPS